MKVADVMVRELTAVGPDEPIAEAVRLMADERVSGLPVTDTHGNLVGVLSSTDILSALAEQEVSGNTRMTFANTRVDELMSRTPRTIDVAATIKDAAEHMLYLDVHRLFVTENGILTGVISQTDIARAVATAKT